MIHYIKSQYVVLRLKLYVIEFLLTHEILFITLNFTFCNNMYCT